MSTAKSTDSSPITIALVGNPNAGKSTLFNALTGLRQHVANYPGVTVEMSKGHYNCAGKRIDVIDLPGTYSLAARSPDELVAVDLLLGRRPEERAPDVIVAVVDATNLDRHLYLATQLMDLGKPVVLAITMIDVAERQQMSIEYTALAAECGVAVVPVQVSRNVGLDQLRNAIIEVVGKNVTSPTRLPEKFEEEAAGLQAGLTCEIPLVLARRLILDVGGATEKWFVQTHGETLLEKITSARTRLAESGHSVTTLEAKARFAWIRGVVARVVTRPAVRPRSWTDRLDRYLTHRVWGTLIFLALMFLLFQSIYVAAEPLMGAIDSITEYVGEFAGDQLSPGPFRSLITDGVIVGVGGVIKFLPQILILFGFIAVLEDCGYMARAAYLMDRVMSRCGLSGKSFIPMLSSVACAVPGIMATRVIENRRDRLATILVAPLMSCSARLPVYYLLSTTFLGTDSGYPWWAGGLAVYAMYLIGFVTAPLVALLLRRTLLRGERSPFLMELPAYKLPSLKRILTRMIDAGTAFVRRAGTLILASMVVVWALLAFPGRAPDGERYEDQIRRAIEAEDEESAKRFAQQRAETSYLGQAGQSLEPLFRPLGWDWKIGMATLASFPAREVIVGTLSTIYQQGDADTKDPEKLGELGQQIRDDWKNQEPHKGRYTTPVALSIMVFFALCCQCASTLAVIRRESRSWFWPAFTFIYMTLLAYGAAFVVYQVGKSIVDLT